MDHRLVCIHFVIWICERYLEVTGGILSHIRCGSYFCPSDVQMEVLLFRPYFSLNKVDLTIGSSSQSRFSTHRVVGLICIDPLESAQFMLLI